MGPPDERREVAETLNASGWVNVDGAEGAFLYAKVHIEKSFEAVVQIAETKQELCSKHKVDILNIDADSSADVHCSSFETLYRS
jgi:hypothetical protein